MGDDSQTSNLHRQAISEALSCNWVRCVELNKQILKLEPENPDCLNRLAKAYFELGRYSLAKKAYEEVLRIDPYNGIAQKNFKKVSSFKKNANIPLANGHTSSISPALFIEEPCTTKLVNLTKVAEPQKLLTLFPGQEVYLVLKNRGVFVTNSHNQYLGVLPDDIGFLMRKLLTGGNKYVTLIKSIKPNGLTVLIREVFRSKKFKNQASFLDEARVLTFSSENISLFNPDQDSPIDEAADAEDLNS